jgi:hypothetical protein
LWENWDQVGFQKANGSRTVRGQADERAAEWLGVGLGATRQIVDEITAPYLERRQLES